MTAAQENIRQRVLAAVPPTESSQIVDQQVEPVIVHGGHNHQKHQSSNSMLIIAAMLGCCIVTLSLVTFFVLSKKNNGDEFKADNRVPPMEHVKPTIPLTNNYVTKSELESVIKNTNQRIEGLSTRVDHHQKRIWLLGVANNENVAIHQQVEAKNHGQADPRYIVFDENWKINRIPDSMSMDKEQQDKLKDSVKPK